MQSALEELGRAIDNLEDQPLRQQTEMFWILQIQFMEMPHLKLRRMIMSYIDSHMYVENERTKKIKNTLDVWFRGWTQEEHNCVATHLALQMAGVV
jgi:hypothetical protein